MPTSSLVLFAFAAALLLLAAFVTFTTGRFEAMVYGIIGAGIFVYFAFRLRRERLRPFFEPRSQEKP